MKEPKEHKVGERFKYCELTYEVKEAENGGCRGCSLLVEEENVCQDYDGTHFELCDSKGRQDGKSVIFVLVDNDNNNVNVNDNVNNNDNVNVNDNVNN